MGPGNVLEQGGVAGVQPRLIQGVRSGDGIGEDQDTIASIRYYAKMGLLNHLNGKEETRESSCSVHQRGMLPGFPVRDREREAPVTLQ